MKLLLSLIVGAVSARSYYDEYAQAQLYEQMALLDDPSNKTSAKSILSIGASGKRAEPIVHSIASAVNTVNMAK